MEAKIREKHICIGILAHVDAGKTTLAESMLFISGSIRKAGRVDHKDAFLDTDAQERSRGITIFSKQARFSWKDMDVTLLDTPGHVDFSAEMERTLQVPDYAVLVISASDGVQGQVLTLWKLLERYDLPVFLFINKMDQPDTDSEKLLEQLKENLSGRCIDFTPKKNVAEPDETLLEDIAVCDEKLMEKYLESGSIENEDIAGMIKSRTIFPCFFGSALKMEGVDSLLDGIYKYTINPVYPDEFGARVYKIGRDEAGNRLTYMKVTGGKLAVKQLISGSGGKWEEKVDQIRLYSGVKYVNEKEVPAGTICVVTGLSRTFSGEGLGIESDASAPVLAPVLTYRINFPPEKDIHVMYKELCKLEEEEPLLHIVWREQLGEIHAQLMGEVQIEVLTNLIAERLGVDVSFDSGSIVYKETISNTVEGVGHYEPLRHYAEVHLLLEPGEAGSGLIFDTVCSEDVLDKNWQRLVLTHLEEKEHIGVLTGSPITDMKITLIAGRAHLKHTEGGDFRQATYRALRQGLCRAKSVLLEPVYEFKLKLPAAMIGRAMSDIQAMHGHFEAPFIDGDAAVITGSAPAAAMQGYQAQVMSYSGGSGRLFLNMKGYEPCHNAEEVIEKTAYDAESDLDNPPSSVFCAHGAGFVVPWYEVEDYMHVESGFKVRGSESGTETKADLNAKSDLSVQADKSLSAMTYSQNAAEDKELAEIFNRTYGGGNKNERGVDAFSGRKVYKYQKVIRADGSDNKAYKSVRPDNEKKDEYLLVDGYNIIFAWEELAQLAKINLDSARDRLMDILSNYQGYRKMTLILVFDAYKVKGNPGSVLTYHNIHVVYTKEAETADQYIEKVTHEMSKKYDVTVATSDGLEQLIIMGQGAARLSAADLKENIMSTNEELRKYFKDSNMTGKQYLFDEVEDELAKQLEDVRLGRKEFD